VALTTARPGTHTRSIAATAAILFFAIVALLFGARDARAAVGGATGSLASTGPVAAYNFDAGSGTTLADLSGNASNGTISGASWTTAGHSGAALSFDGNSDSVTVPDASNLDLSSAMTLEAWVYPTVLGSSWRTILTKDQSGGAVYGLFANSDTATPAALTALPAQDVVRGPNRLAKFAWTHLAATYDGATLRLYVNGVQSASVPGTGAMTSSTQPLRIGGNSLSQWFRGRIDDVRIYNRALSASEITNDMRTAVAADTQAPSTPNGLAASSPTMSSVSLSWGASSDNVGIAGYTLYRNGAAIGSTTATTYQAGGLACGTGYTFSVDAFDAAGNRSGRATVTASTSACPPPPDSTPPTTPTGLAASGATPTSITLAWSASNDDVGVAGYGLYRNSTSVGSTSGRTYTFSGLSCGTSYQLAVDAFDAMGNRSPRSSVSAATTPCPDATAPTAPSGLATSSVTQSSIKLSWTASTDNTGVTGYGAYINGTATGSTITTSYTFSALSCGTNYSLAVDAYDAAGNRSGKATITASTSACIADTTPPSVPQNEAFTGVSQTTIGLSWSAATDNIGVAGYSLYLNNVKVGTTTGTSYTYTGLACGTSYTVGLEAFDAAGNASNRAYATGTTATSACTPSADTQAPTIPAALAATSATTTSIVVGWGASLDNVGVAGYGAYRNGSSVGSSTTTSYTFPGLTCGTSYTLAIDAYDAAGNRSGKATISAATSACPVADTQPPTVPQGQAIGTATQTSIPMSWNASSDNVGVAGYRLYLNGALAGTTQQLSYTFSGLTCGTSYTVSLAAYDAAGNASDPALAQGPATTAACSTPPPPPPPPSGSTGLANLWVDTNGGSCARQASPGAYADAQACSWNQAYQAAQTGDTIIVKGGSYGDVTIGPNKSSIGSAGVTFKTAGGESVTISDFENGSVTGGSGANNVSFVGPVTATTFRSDGTSNVTVDNWRVDCGGCAGVQIFHLENSTNITVKNSDISDNRNNSLIWIDGNNLTFEHNEIHDAGLDPGSGAHTECMYAWTVTNLTLKRNHFYHCSVMDVFITGSDVANGGYVENNVFEKPWEYTGQISNSALAFHFRNGGSPSPDPSNWDFRYNTFVGPLSITTSENPVGPGGMRVIGNVFLADAPCGQSNTTYAYNAFVSGGCGSNSITNSLSTYQAGFTSTADPGTYSLKSTSVLKDKGSSASYPSQDFAGTSRFSGAAPDIGAYEAP
jgi:chitodextrinase